MIGKLKFYFFAFISALAAALGLYIAGRKSGKDALKAKQAEHTLKTVKRANEIRDESRRLDDSALDSKLRKFTRK